MLLKSCMLVNRIRTSSRRLTCKIDTAAVSGMLRYLLPSPTPCCRGKSFNEKVVAVQHMAEESHQAISIFVETVMPKWWTPHRLISHLPKELRDSMIGRDFKLIAFLKTLVVLSARMCRSFTPYQRRKFYKSPVNRSRPVGEYTCRATSFRHWKSILRTM
jgi:hypothetical protein